MRGRKVGRLHVPTKKARRGSCDIGRFKRKAVTFLKPRVSCVGDSASSVSRRGVQSGHGVSFNNGSANRSCRHRGACGWTHSSRRPGKRLDMEGVGGSDRTRGLRACAGAIMLALLAAGCAPHCASVQYVALPDGTTVTFAKTGCLAATRAVYATTKDGSMEPLYGFDSANPAAPLLSGVEHLIP